MIGFYDYTVILTYLSLLSAMAGIGLSISGHPLLAILCLLFCGLCDMFDGRVARRKKNRTETEKNFGIQIDSLSDLVAFGVLPAVNIIVWCHRTWYACGLAAFYVLAGLIRLAYFNVTEEVRQKETDECRKAYSGLPITSSALIFPVFFCFAGLFHNKVAFQLTLCGVMVLTGMCFILPFRIRKPHSRELWAIFAFGILVAAAILLFWLHGRYGLFR